MTIVKLCQLLCGRRGYRIQESECFAGSTDTDTATDPNPERRRHFTTEAQRAQREEKNEMGSGQG
jgi:hypothetical protein